MQSAGKRNCRKEGKQNVEWSCWVIEGGIEPKRGLSKSRKKKRKDSKDWA